MSGLRASYNTTGRAVPGEADCIVAPVDAWVAGHGRPGIVYAHGATGTMAQLRSTVTNRADHLLVNELALAGFVVLVAELGGDTYCNDTAIARIETARTYLTTTLQCPGPKIGLVGGSMGAGNSLAYLKAHPDKVLFAGVQIPFLDIADVRDNNRLGLASAINAAYGGTYDDVVHGPDHSPVRFAASLPNQATVPIRMWTSSDDPACIPSTADEFMSLRPSTVRTNLGAVGHAPSSYGALATRQQIVDFCVENTP